MKTNTKKPPLKKLKRGFWKPEEDSILKNHVKSHGEGNWPSVPQKSGLKRSGKSCRLRWKNYLRPNIKRGTMSGEEEDLIIRMHKLLGNRWSLIAGRLPGRTDNEVKNYWNTHLNKRSLNNDKEDQKSCAMAPNLTTQGHDHDEEEDSADQVEDLMSLSLSEPQMPPNYVAFIFDEDPFMPYFDSFLLFRALGLKVDTHCMNLT